MAADVFGRPGLIRRPGAVRVNDGLGLLLQPQQEPLRHTQQDRRAQQCGGRVPEAVQRGVQGGELQHAHRLQQGDEGQPRPGRQRAKDRRAEQRRPRAAVGDGDTRGEHQPLHAADQTADRARHQQLAVAEPGQHPQREQGGQDDPGGPVVEPRQLDGVAVGRLVDLAEQLIEIGAVDQVQLFGVRFVLGRQQAADRVLPRLPPWLGQLAQLPQGALQPGDQLRTAQGGQCQPFCFVHEHPLGDLVGAVPADDAGVLARGVLLLDLPEQPPHGQLRYLRLVVARGIALYLEGEPPGQRTGLGAGPDDVGAGDIDPPGQDHQQHVGAQQYQPPAEVRHLASPPPCLFTRPGAPGTAACHQGGRATLPDGRLPHTNGERTRATDTPGRRRPGRVTGVQPFPGPGGRSDEPGRVSASGSTTRSNSSSLTPLASAASLRVRSWSMA